MRAPRVRVLVIAVFCAVAAAVVVGAGSSGVNKATAGSAVPASAVASVKFWSTPPLIIPQSRIGLKPFSPKKGASIYNISCALSNVACTAIADNLKSGAKALGYKYARCDAGASPDAPNTCFTNAINAKPDVIVVNAVGAAQAAAGYAAAKKAGIPVVGAFTGDPGDGKIAKVQVAAGGCLKQGAIVADGIAVQSKGKADILWANETSIGCDIERLKGFSARIKQVCPDCKVKVLTFDNATIQQSLPQQLQAAINANPNLNWIVGCFDVAAGIAVTQVQQAGKQDSISVAGMDGQPANIDFMLKKQVQKLDVAFAFASTPWSAIDAAARIYSGLKVPASIPAQQLLVTWDNAKTLLPAKTYNGPTTYQAQFKKLWKLK